MITLGDVIKKARKEKKLTQKQLAKRVGINSMYLSQLETGFKQGSITSLKKIAYTLGLDLGMLAGLRKNGGGEISRQLLKRSQKYFKKKYKL